MKVLLVTGKLAEKKVRDVAIAHGCRVYTDPSDVASLIKPRVLAERLKKQREILNGVSFILLPGLIMGDIQVVEKATGVKTFRGPRDVVDLDEVLTNLKNKSIKLSKKVPADRLLKDRRRSNALDELREVEARRYVEAKLRTPGNFKIGSVAVGPDFPPRVVAEIVEAERLTDEEVLDRARYYIREGADIIDIGMNTNDPDRAEELVSLLKPLGVPVSIDTMEEENIRSALEAGVDLILSFNYELLQVFEEVETPSVIIPEKGGHVPRDPWQRVRLLEENVKMALDRGFKRVIPDPLLQPISMGFVDSLAAYREFSRRWKGEPLPMLMGVGNITELLDADSPGINAVLAGAAMEVGASLLFTTEAGDKTRGCVAELSRAAKMMFLSYKKGRLPKDLGVDLLILKEKKIRRDSYQIEKGVEVKEVIARPKKDGVQMDRKGYFKIYVDDRIRCLHYHKNKPHVSIVGETAEEICDTIYSLGLVEELSHALYLGRELARAEEALKLGKSYRQS